MVNTSLFPFWPANSAYFSMLGPCWPLGCTGSSGKSENIVQSFRLQHPVAADELVRFGRAVALSKGIGTVEFLPQKAFALALVLVQCTGQAQ